MSEVNVENATEAVASDETVSEDVTVDADTADEGQSFDAEYVRQLRKESAKYRTQNKELADKAAKYDEYVQSQKSEQERMAEALASAQQERDTLKGEMLRFKVAQSKNLPPSLVDRLRGDTEEEMAADADALLEGLKGQFAPKAKPSPDATGAGVVGDADAPSNPLELAAAVRGSR
jgi:hypothetical protein